MAALKDRDRIVRISASRSLGKIKSQDAVTPLMGIMLSGKGLLSRTAALSLGMIGDKRAEEALFRIYREHPDFLLRKVQPRLSPISRMKLFSDPCWSL